MVEIYLNPDNENLWEGLDGDGAGNADSANMEAVRICERLLREIKRKPKSLRHEMLECHALIGTKTQPNIELALSNFVETLKKDSECVPALRGMAMALLKLPEPAPRSSTGPGGRLRSRQWRASRQATACCNRASRA